MYSNVAHVRGIHHDADDHLQYRKKHFYTILTLLIKTGQSIKHYYYKYCYYYRLLLTH